MEKGERYHLERRIIEMETILNLCVNGKVFHKDHARGT
jgi:hypothetical protein